MLLTADGGRKFTVTTCTASVQLCLSRFGIFLHGIRQACPEYPNTKFPSVQALARTGLVRILQGDYIGVSDDTARMPKRLIGADVEFRVQPADALWAVEVNPDQIVQVVIGE